MLIYSPNNGSCPPTTVAMSSASYSPCKLIGRLLNGNHSTMASRSETGAGSPSRNLTSFEMALCIIILRSQPPTLRTREYIQALRTLTTREESTETEKSAAEPQEAGRINGSDGGRLWQKVEKSSLTYMLSANRSSCSFLIVHRITSCSSGPESLSLREIEISCK